jgi:uncharacterized protein with HEPN domain
VTRFIAYDDFERHDLLPDVVMRQIEIIGEASKAVERLSPGLLAQKPEIEWKKIAGMRDVMIHQYFHIWMRTVFDVVKIELPTLIKAVEDLLALVRSSK